MSRFWEDSRRIAVRPLFLLPCRLKIRHRLLTARSITAIMRALRDARGDRPEPTAILRRCVGPHDPTDVMVAVEHIVIVVRPFAARAALRCAFERQHGFSVCRGSWVMANSAR